MMNIKELIPLFVAALGLTPVVLKWLSDRSTAAAERRAMEHAKDQVEFWRTWLQAQREVSTDDRFAELKGEVADRLDALMQRQDALAKPSEQSSDPEAQPNFLQRLFLAYFPHTVIGWGLHTMFYLTVSFTAMIVFVSSIPPDDPDANPSWAEFKGELDFVIAVVLFFGLIGFVIGRFANRVERRYWERVRRSEEASEGRPVAAEGDS